MCKIFVSNFLRISQDKHTHPFNGSFSGTTQVSRYQKGKTNLDFTGFFTRQKSLKLLPLIFDSFVQKIKGGCFGTRCVRIINYSNLYFVRFVPFLMNGSQSVGYVLYYGVL